MDVTETRTVDKSGWPPGPWHEEPDRVSWTHGTGLPCLITRHPRRGHLRGYVAVPPGHPWHGRAACLAGPLAVHWEISWAGPLPPDDEMTAPGLEDPWWFGFHCHHAEDVIPADPDTVFEGAEYRGIGYVTAVCTILAGQLAAIAVAHAERVAKAAFVCPRCGTPSASQADAANGYCGACRDFTGATVAQTGEHPCPAP